MHFFLLQNRKPMYLSRSGKTKMKKKEPKTKANENVRTFLLCMKKGMSSVDGKITKK